MKIVAVKSSRAVRRYHHVVRCPRGRLLAHARRKLYELAAVAKAPVATEAVQRIDQLFAVERKITGPDRGMPGGWRGARSAPILADFEPWLSDPGNCRCLEAFLRT